MSKEIVQSNRFRRMRNITLSAIAAMGINACNQPSFYDTDCSRQTIVSGRGQEISRGRSEIVKRVYATDPSNPAREGSVFIAIEPNAVNPGEEPILEEVNLPGNFKVRVGVFYPSEDSLTSTGAIGQDLDIKKPTGLWTYQKRGFVRDFCNIVRASWRFGRIVEAEWIESGPPKMH